MASNLTNNMNQQCPDDYLYSKIFATVKLRFSPSITILIYGIYLLPFCFGIFGNISVCLIFFQQRKLRSITNTFLMNLCLNDLIVLCVSIPMTLSAALLENWVFGAFLCKFVNFTPTLTALVSTFTVAVISVERWLFIVNKKKFDRRITIITLILLWLVSILIALPEFISRYIQEFAPPPIEFPIMNTNQPNTRINENNNDNNPVDFSTLNAMKSPCQIRKIHFCVMDPGLRMRIFSYIVITVQYLVPFLFVSVSCYSISRFLKRRMKLMRAYQTHHSSSRNSAIVHNNNNHNHSTKEKQPKRKRQKSHLDEITEQDFTSCDESPVTLVTDENQCNHLMTRIRHMFQGPEHVENSTLSDRPNHSSSSVVSTEFIPTVRAQSHSERRFHRSRKLLICVAALFTISWLPLTIVQIYLEHNEEITRDEPNFVYGFLLIPCYLISSLSAWMNPVIYNYVNRSFRREFYALYPCCFKPTSSLSLVDAITERTEMPTAIGKRQTVQGQKDLEGNTNSELVRTKSRSSVRFITYADGQTKRATTVVMNEHV